MAAKRKENGRDYELIVKAIYQALLQQDQAKNLEVLHNAKVQGLTSAHQIDVFWKFELADVNYRAIVQVKKEKRPATLGDILTFSAVVDDIPGNPRGIFITRAGFQKGAIDCARKQGIVLAQLDHLADRPPIEMTTLSFATAELLPESLRMRTVVYTPEARDVGIVGDHVWAMQHAPSLLRRPARFKISWNDTRFVDESGNDLGTLASRVRAYVEDARKSGELVLDFAEPTFVCGLRISGRTNSAIERIKIVQMRLTLEVVKRIYDSPLRKDAFTTYVLKNVLEGSERFALVSGDETNPQAVVSVSLRKVA